MRTFKARPRISLLLGCCLLCAGVHAQTQLYAHEQRYSELAREVKIERRGEEETGQDDAAAPSPGEGRDWAALRQANPDIAGWIELESPRISLPVVRNGEHEPGWYLSHDFWGEESQVGCPFFDDGCADDGAALLVYGHHLTGTSYAFSELAGRYRQDEFAALGKARLELADGQSIELVPLCSRNVADTDELALRFSFASQAELADWLAKLCEGAGAKSPEADALARRASRAVSLATCSSSIPGQPWRCVTTFVEVRK